MFFNPNAAKDFAEHLEAGNHQEALNAALSVTDCGELVNDATYPAEDYNESLVPGTIRDLLGKFQTDSMALVYGSYVPQILGFALLYIEKWVNEVQQTSSEPDNSLSPETTTPGP